MIIEAKNNMLIAYRYRNKDLIYLDCAIIKLLSLKFVSDHLNIVLLGQAWEASVLSGGHGTQVACTKISCEKWKAPHLVVEMVRTSRAQKFPEQTDTRGPAHGKS